MDAACDNGNEIVLVWVKVQLGDEELPLWVDSDFVAEQVLQLGDGFLECAVFVVPVVSDANLGFERSEGVC